MYDGDNHSRSHEFQILKAVLAIHGLCKHNRRAKEVWIESHAFAYGCQKLLEPFEHFLVSVKIEYGMGCVGIETDSTLFDDFVSNLFRFQESFAEKSRKIAWKRDDISCL